MGRTIVLAELEQHSKEDDVWIVVDGEVYDMTAFAPTHPGGAESESPRNQLRAVSRPRHELLANLPPPFPQVIYQYAGKDASAAYNEVHSPSLIRKHLGQTGLVGSFDASTMPPAPQASVANPIVAETSRAAGPAKPDLDDIINLDDFEKAAEQTLSKKAWAYIHGASNDNITRDANQHMYKRIWLRPAVMRDISVVDTSCELFGCRLSMPVYISPTGAVRMAGPEGEVGQAKAAATAGIIQCMSTPASYPHDEILAATKDQAFFQLYVNKNRAESEKLIRQVTSSGLVKAIFVTVDCPVISKREDDERVKADEKTGTTLTPASRVSAGKKDKKGSGLTRQNSNFIDSTLNWNDIAWLRSITNLPIVVKGIQRWEDAVMAMKWKCDGIVISNHGGRAADTSPPSILVLMEIQKHCPQVFRSMKVLTDGGIRRGSDVVKALCLGASAVGIGRPFMYAVGYGQEGVEHLASILQEEIKVAMQLCGITNLAREASPSYVNTADLDHLVYSRHSSTLPLMDKIKGRL